MRVRNWSGLVQFLCNTSEISASLDDYFSLLIGVLVSALFLKKVIHWNWPACAVARRNIAGSYLEFFRDELRPFRLALMNANATIRSGCWGQKDFIMPWICKFSLFDHHFALNWRVRWFLLHLFTHHKIIKSRRMAGNKRCWSGKLLWLVSMPRERTAWETLRHSCRHCWHTESRRQSPI